MNESAKEPSMNKLNYCAGKQNGRSTTGTATCILSEHINADLCNNESMQENSHMLYTRKDYNTGKRSSTLDVIKDSIKEARSVTLVKVTVQGLVPEINP